MRRRMALTALAALVITGAWALVARAGQDKVDICHRADTQQWVLISIADPAWPAHEEHGDKLAVGGKCPDDTPPL